MSIIIDNNVAGILFGNPKNRPEAATKVLKYINNKNLIVVIGGKLKDELCGSNMVKKWLSEGLKSGRANNFRKVKVKAQEERLLQNIELLSDDPHVLALALESGTRLLYSHDRRLGKDFKNGNIIPNPRGKVYKTDKNGDFTYAHQRLLDKHVAETLDFRNKIAN